MSRNNIIIRLGLGILIIFLGVLVLQWNSKKEPTDNKGASYSELPGCEEEMLALEGFVEKYFIEDGFIRTNLTDSERGELASGQDILSESVGLLMLYYLKRDEGDKFDAQVKILMEHFRNGNGLFKWRIRKGLNEETVNATVDDLRIVKALIMAAERWERDDYEAIARDISAKLLKHAVTGNSLRAFDSPNSSEAPLAYNDFEAMELMGRFNKKWYKIASVNKKKILESQVKDLPLFRDKWYAKEEGFPTLENLMVMMHLSERGIKNPQALSWLKQQLKEKGLYSRYSVQGEPLSKVESPAIYAITALIAEHNNDKELYLLATNRLKAMQNLANNEYYGGFIDLRQLTAYSFDQLLSLLAYNGGQGKSTNALKLMNYLKDIYGKKIIAGQEVYQDFKEVEAICQVTGKKPALLGFDFMDYSPSRAERLAKGMETEKALQWWREGGLVTFCWHWNAPDGLIDKEPDKQWYRGFYNEATTFNFAKGVNNSNSEEYRLLLRDIDVIAEELKKLKQEGVPVLWRPLHEASGGWFWWGSQGPEAYKKLWRLMYERMTEHHRLNNLIWVWNGGHRDWYPGDDVVDIIGVDFYGEARDYSPRAEEFRKAENYSKAPKMVALTETGVIPDPDLLLKTKAKWLWFMTWSGEFVLAEDQRVYSEAYTEAAMLKKAYNHGYVITKEELPQL